MVVMTKVVTVGVRYELSKVPCWARVHRCSGLQTPRMCELPTAASIRSCAERDLLPSRGHHPSPVGAGSHSRISWQRRRKVLVVIVEAALPAQFLS